MQDKSRGAERNFGPLGKKCVGLYSSESSIVNGPHGSDKAMKGPTAPYMQVLIKAPLKKS